MKSPESIGDPLRRARVSRLRLLLWAASGLALASLCLEYGFPRPPLPAWALVSAQLLAIGVYVLTQTWEVVGAADRIAALRRRAFDVVLVATCIVVLAVEAEATGQPVLKASTIYVATLQLAIGVRFGIGVVRFNLALSERRLHPGRMMVLGFLVLIVTGAMLLSLPRAVSEELRHERAHYLTGHLVNCLFTSVSATCVTGLAVYDTGKDFTRFGQIVILALIQLGGLGIMIFGSLFGILMGRQLSLRHSLALQDALSHQTLGQVRRMVLFVVAVTFACELAGAAVLYTMWPAGMSARSERVFYSVFHAVSAFCNAGFSLQSDSLVGCRGAWQVYGGIMPLIVVGGLGFPVLHDLVGAARARIARRKVADGTEAIVLPRSRAPGRFHPFSLHTKLVLVSTGLLIVLPAVALFVFESTGWRGDRSAAVTAAMADMTPGARAAAALFQSVTTRTAGFNTVPLDPESLSPASAFLCAMLMFIGGSPASTAGGAKTVAVATLILGVYSTLRGRSRVEGFQRTIPRVAIRRAMVVVVLMLGLAGAVTLLLCVSERGEQLGEILFESVSACGTVGLSTGLTPRLTGPGRLIIMLAMFAGRVGPLTLLVALAGEPASGRYEYPEETPVIG